MAISFFTGTIFLWLIFIVYWLISSRDIKPDVYSQPLLTRIVISAGFALGAALMYWQTLSIGWLGLVLFPQNSITGIIGLILCVAGLMCAIWARRSLGANWSDGINLKAGHELILSGPYRIVRHPIYVGVLLLVLGTAVIVGEVRSLLAFVSFIGSLLLRIKDEEKILTKQFPQEYSAYKKRTKMLIPWIG